MKTLRFTLSLIASLGVASTIVAQDSAPATEEAPPPTPAVTQQAGPASLRSHVVRLDSENKLNGRISLIDSATGNLISVSSVTVRLLRNGVLKAEARPADDGTFSVSVEPGGYSMLASGPGAFLAMSVNVQPRVEDIAKLPRNVRLAMLSKKVSSQLAVSASAVPPTNFVALRALMGRYLPKKDSSLYLQTTDNNDTGADGALIAGTDVQHQQVSITEDGLLRGRVRRLLGDDARIRQLNVFLLRNNEYANQAPVNPNGTFEFKDTRPGVYSLVAVGRDGFLAFSIDVVKTETATTRLGRNGIQTVGLRMQQLPQIDGALVPPQDLNQENYRQFFNDNNQVADQNSVPPVMNDGTIVGDMGGGGAFGGGGGGGTIGGGGGGGVGGGGGLAGALLGGAAGVGISALLDDDDSRAQSSPGGP